MKTEQIDPAHNYTTAKSGRCVELSQGLQILLTNYHRDVIKASIKNGDQVWICWKDFENKKGEQDKDYLEAISKRIC